MIDTYRTAEDLANWRNSQREAARRRIAADPRFYDGQLYATMIDRNVAEARDRLRGAIDYVERHHRWEIRLGVRLGSNRSVFGADGRRK